MAEAKIRDPEKVSADNERFKRAYAALGIDNIFQEIHNRFVDELVSAPTTDHDTVRTLKIALQLNKSYREILTSRLRGIELGEKDLAEQLREAKVEKGI